MKRILSLTVLSVAMLSGCATHEYALYAEAQKSMAQSRAAAEAARYAALAEIAKSGDTAAKVAAVISINLGQNNNSQSQQSIAAPKSVAETALQWTSVLLPGLTQIYGINKNAEVSISQSNNAALVARSTNEAFVGIAGRIQAPQANVTTTTTTTDSSNRSTSNTTTTSSDSSNRSSTTNTSSVGRDNNTGANSANTGRIAGGNLTDNTSTPTVVRPEVVNTTTTTTTNNNSNNTGTTGP